MLTTHDLDFYTGRNRILGARPAPATDSRVSKPARSSKHVSPRLPELNAECFRRTPSALSVNPSLASVASQRQSLQVTLPC